MRHLRMTTRRWMIAVAVLAMMTSFGLRYSHCSVRAEHFAAMAVDRRMMASVPGMTEWAYSNLRRKASVCELMKARYERAALRFWDPLPDESQRNW